MIRSMIVKRSILAAAVVTAALSMAALAPSVHVAHGALIANTTVTSTIVDGHGYAIALTPAGLSCGVDTTVWCEVAR